MGLLAFTCWSAVILSYLVLRVASGPLLQIYVYLLRVWGALCEPSNPWHSSYGSKGRLVSGVAEGAQAEAGSLDDDEGG